MFRMFFLLLAVFNCFQFLLAKQSAYEYTEELRCWQCVTDTANGYRVLRKRSGCVNVFAIFDKSGECTDMFAYQVMPGDTSMHFTSSSVFPRDALAVSRVIWETRGSDSERSYSLGSYALQDEVTREWRGILDFDNEELSVGVDGSCVVRKHHGHSVGLCSVFDALDKNDAGAFQLPEEKKEDRIRLLGSPSGFENEKKPEDRRTVSRRQTSNRRDRKGVEVAEKTERDSKAALVSASLQTSSKGKLLSEGVGSEKPKVDGVQSISGDLISFRKGVSDSGYDNHTSKGVLCNGSGFSVVYSKLNEGSCDEVAVASSHSRSGCLPSNSTAQPVPFQLTSKEVIGDVRGRFLSMDNGVQSRCGNEEKKSEKWPFAFSYGGKRWAVVYARKAFVREGGTSTDRQLGGHELVPSFSLRSPEKGACSIYEDETNMILKRCSYTYVSLPDRMVAPEKVECSFVPIFEVVK